MGSVPVELGNLSSLVELNLSMNALSGLLHVEFLRMRNLEVLVLRDNRLEGRLPDGLFSSLAKLRVLELRENKFAGALPVALWSLQNLQVLDVTAVLIYQAYNSRGSACLLFYRRFCCYFSLCFAK
ncbi:hypothetical protein OIU78_022579 [Salix suchowensis]|nr:hypothetical protein OIU78_022579 [Salix suchowensis]